MEVCIRPEIKAVQDFNGEGVKNNTYVPGTMAHKIYEREWTVCFDNESFEARRDLEVICG